MLRDKLWVESADGRLDGRDGGSGCCCQQDHGPQRQWEHHQRGQRGGRDDQGREQHWQGAEPAELAGDDGAGDRHAHREGRQDRTGGGVVTLHMLDMHQHAEGEHPGGEPCRQLTGYDSCQSRDPQ